MSLTGKHLLLGISGGIAAYKSVSLLREFQKAGADVRVVMTPSATRFVGVETFATLSRHDVAVDVFNDSSPGDSWTRHIHWAGWADLYVIAPCTANTLGKLVHGLADNMLTSVALAARCPLLLCPTMDAEMMHHPAVAENLHKASRQGYHLLEPDEGYLASGLSGSGRLPEPDTIFEAVESILAESGDFGTTTPETGEAGLAQTRGNDGSEKSKPLSGKRIIVTAGPTREPIDAVRYISNPSSGKMGFAMAKAAGELGGDVLLLHGPVSETPPVGIDYIEFTTAEELFDLVKEHADADVVIMAAAVADFRPVAARKEKIKKEKGVTAIDLTPTQDILQWLGEVNQSGQIRIGFAMETGELIERARKKLLEKNMHWICANDLNEEGAGFATDSNRITLLGHEDQTSFEGTKNRIALQILKYIFDSQES